MYQSLEYLTLDEDCKKTNTPVAFIFFLVTNKYLAISLSKLCVLTFKLENILLIFKQEKKKVKFAVAPSISSY